MTTEETLSNECPICWNEYTKSTTLSCSHKFCHQCICKHVTMNGVTCPLCRQTITSFQPFRKLSTLNTLNEKITTLTCCVKLGSDMHAGVVLRNQNNANNQSEYGVVVSNLKQRDAFANFMKIGDIVISINGIPVKDHVQAIQIINENTKKNECVVLQIERKRKVYTFWKKWTKTKKNSMNVSQSLEATPS